MAARDRYADVTGLAWSNGVRSPHDKRPSKPGRCLDWPDPNQWERPMVVAKRIPLYTPTKYRVDFILTTA